MSRAGRTLLAIALAAAANVSGAMRAPLTAQTAVEADTVAQTVAVTAGARYRAGALHRLLFGAHYRDLWTRPIQVPVLDLSRFAGGLEPLRRGGGRQTRSLRFRGADGREYAFRSTDKDMSGILPVELRETLVDRLVQDQTSAGHPAAPLVVAPLLDAAGVLHPEPRMVVLPDDPRLGEFREEFAGMLGTIEERPDEGAAGAPGFAGATRVVSSEKLFELLEESPDHRVDARGFLAARLVDLFLGDWDRHHNQWRWATRDTAPPIRWLPIPGDRDLALVRLDGLLLDLARTWFPQLASFSDEYPSMLGLTWNGRELDRRLLVELEWPVWDSVAHVLQSRLTDSVIAAAMDRLPPEYRPLDGPRLRQALLRRRDGLPDAARRFYRHLAGEVDVHTTDAAERVVAEHSDDGGMLLTIAVGDTPGSAPYFHRRFNPRETREVRLYLHGGDDRVQLRGAEGGRILLRVIGGGGDDVLAASSRADGARLYDHQGENQVIGAGVRVDRRPYAPPGPPPAPPIPPRDWGRDWRPLLWVTSAPDVGLFLGGGAVRHGYGFRKHPYASRILVRAAYATSAASGRAEVRADFRRANSRVRTLIEARASGLEVLRFHGLGNETELTAPDQFYRVEQEQYSLGSEVVMPLGRGEAANLALGPVVKYSETGLDPRRLIGALRPYGTGSFGQLGLRTEAQVDTRDRPVATTRGVLLLAGGSYYPGVWDVERGFGEVHGSAATYLTASRTTLALRASGKRVLGDYPFHEAAFLGGAHTVRLGREQRYAGDAAVWGNAELRVFLARTTLVLPADVGVFGLGDVGRVYVEGERSERWHRAVGGGIWIAFLRRANAVSLAIARGEERTGVYIQAGFQF